MTHTLDEPVDTTLRVYTFGPYHVEVAERRLLFEETIQPLPAKAFDLLVLLIGAAGCLATREELITALWPHSIVEENNLSGYVSALRKALGDEGEAPRYIETVRGHGYRFIAAVVVANKPPIKPVVVTQERPQPRRRVLLVAGAIATVAIAVMVDVMIFRGATQPTAAVLEKRPWRSIAVLPFENLSADPANQYFVSGVQDTILTKLASIGELKVIARASTANYPSRPDDLGAVAQQLDVDTVLEGSVQKAGNQVLINVQLIDARTLAHLWAQVYARPLDNIFDVERDVAERVATALETRLLPAEASRLADVPTKNEQAYDFFLKAEYLAIQVEQGKIDHPAEATEQAIELYRKALARDPRFALAYARLSSLFMHSFWFGLDSPPTRVANATEAATRALALEPELAQAHLAMGHVLYWGRHDFKAALAEFEKAREGLPNNADAIGAIASIHRRQGKWVQALSGFEQAAKIDARNPQWPDALGSTLTQLRRYSEATQQFDRALSIDPKRYEVLLHKAWTVLLNGHPEQARGALAEIPPGTDAEGNVAGSHFTLASLDRDPDAALAAVSNAPLWLSTMVAYGTVPASFLRAQSYALKGDTARARRMYQDAQHALMEALSSNPDIAYLWSVLGLVETALGENDKAIEAGRKAVEIRPPSDDAMSGPYSLVMLAKIQARAGNVGEAVNLLRQLLAMPSGLYVSIPLLKIDPAWETIRDDPRFQALVIDKNTDGTDKRAASNPDLADQGLVN